jgi:mannosyltransferase
MRTNHGLIESTTDVPTEVRRGPANRGSGVLRRVRGAGVLRRIGDRSARLDPALVFLLAAAISLAGAARPSFWYDEAATISAAGNRSLGDLARLLGHVDAVHGLYYLFMHGWFSIFPPSEFWSRAPSGLAIGAAAAGVVVLAKQFSSRPVALCSGVVFAILPRTTWAGIEARPYAFSVMAAVWTCVLLVVAVRRGKSVLWLAYTAAALLSIVLDVYLVFMMLVHVVLVAVLRRSVLPQFIAAAIAALVLAVPFIFVAYRQVGQVGWLPGLSGHTIIDVGIKQYFDRSAPFALLAVVIVGAWMLLRRGAAPPDSGERQLARIAIAWAAIPTGIILICSALVSPIYYPRYLCFTAPGIALFLGICIAGLARTPLRISAVLVALMLAGFPNYFFGQRGPYAKYGMDYSQVADLITQKAQPGDCLLLDDTVTWQPGPIRPLVAARPAAYKPLVDVGLGAPAASINKFWDFNLAPFVVADRISQCNVVWTITQREDTFPDHEQGIALPPGPHFSTANAFWVPRELGFRLVERWQFNYAQVIKAIR